LGAYGVRPLVNGRTVLLLLLLLLLARVELRPLIRCLRRTRFSNLSPAWLLLLSVSGLSTLLGEYRRRLSY
jgi:hypothetical protein